MYLPLLTVLLLWLEKRNLSTTWPWFGDAWAEATTRENVVLSKNLYVASALLFLPPCQQFWTSWAMKVVVSLKHPSSACSIAEAAPGMMLWCYCYCDYDSQVGKWCRRFGSSSFSKRACPWIKACSPTSTPCSQIGTQRCFVWEADPDPPLRMSSSEQNRSQLFDNSPGKR